MKTSKLLITTAWLLATVAAATGVYRKVFTAYERESQLMVDQHLASLDVAYRSTVQMHQLDIQTRMRADVLTPAVITLLQQISQARDEDVPLLRGRLYRELRPAYQSMVGIGLRQVQFHRPDGRSLLRMWSPELTDDPLFDRRPSVRLVNTRLDSVSGFEGGGLMPGFRRVEPILEEGKHLGSVEVSLAFDTLRDNLAALLPASDIGLLLHRRSTLDIVLPGMGEHYTPSELSPEYVTEATEISSAAGRFRQAPEVLQLLPVLAGHDRAQAQLKLQTSFALPMRVQGSGHVASFLSIRDIEGLHAAYVVAFTELPALTQLYRSVRINAGMSALLVAALGWGLWFLFRQRARLGKETRQLRVISQSMADGLIVQDQLGAVRFINRAASQMLGYKPHEILGRNAHALIHAHPDEGSDAASQCPILRAAEGGEAYVGEQVFFDRDGRALDVEVRSQPLDDGSSELGSVTLFKDVTEQRAARARLQLAASVFEHANEGISVTDAQGHFAEVNDAFTRITGYEREAVLGRNPRMLSSGRQSKAFYADMWQTVAVHGRWRGEVWNRHASGSLYAAMLTVTAVRDTAGLLSHYVGILSDITALKEHAEELERLARFDELTGVANRRLLTERLHAALTRADQADGQVVIAYLDLDGFKQVNDERGHEAGDQVLVEYSRRLRACVRECDTVARLGGDEFVIVLCHVQHDDDWLPVVRRLLETASAPFADAGQPLHLTVSIGVTRYPADRADADTLLRHADHAMYEAKRTGKNRYELFNADSERESMALHDFGSAVRKGVREGEFVLHFQPQVNLRTGQLVGVEALVRWQHPEHGLLMPGSFLPQLAGSSELIEIDRWVLDTAMATLAQWPAQDVGNDLRMSVNLSAQRVQESGFIPELWEVLARYPSIAPPRLELELLESAALDDFTAVSQKMAACRGLGVRFAIDDFGTGFSTLTYVRRLPASTLKIDQSFVRDMLVDADDRAIVQAVIGLAQSFQREVLAEGVETPDHGRALMAMGCDVVQGYGVARPMAAERFPAWARSWPQDWQSRWQVSADGGFVGPPPVKSGSVAGTAAVAARVAPAEA